MSRTQSQLWVHLLWTTRAQVPFLTPSIQSGLLDQMRSVASEHDLGLDAVNALADHVHVLCLVRPRIPVADIIDRLKGVSAHWINAHGLTPLHFSWEPWYVGSSIGPNEIESHRQIIHGQEALHGHLTIIEEARGLLAGTLVNADETILTTTPV